MSETTYTSVALSKLPRQEIDLISAPQALTAALVQIGTKSFRTDGRQIVFLRINFSIGTSVDVDFIATDGSSGVKFNKDVQAAYTANDVGPNRLNADQIGYLEIDVSGMDEFSIKMIAGTLGGTAAVLSTARLILPTTPRRWRIGKPSPARAKAATNTKSSPVDAGSTASAMCAFVQKPHPTKRAFSTKSSAEPFPETLCPPVRKGLWKG